MSTISNSLNKTPQSVKTKRGGKSPKLLINSTDVKPIIRQSSDIDIWRNALRQADRGKRTNLYNLYSDLLLDNILYDSMDKRIKAITNSELTFTRDGQIDIEMEALIDSLQFEEMLTEIMNSIFWGISVIELEFNENGFVCHSLPRSHIRREFGEIAIDQNDERGIPYRNNPFVMEIGRERDLGLILRAAPYIIYKRNNQGDWAQYVEIFGRPIRVFTYETFDEAAKIETTKAAEASGGNLVVVMPKGSDFKVEGGAQSGDGAIYDNKRKACNEEVMIGILGQTMTTVQGDKGARSLGEVHMDVLEAKHLADKRYVQRILNTQLLPILERLGYPVKGGYFLFPKKTKELTITEKCTLIEGAVKLVPIATQYVYDSLNIPRPEPGEEVIMLQAAPVADDPENDPDDPNLDPKENQEKAMKNVITLLERAKRFFVPALEMGAQITETNQIDSLEVKVNKHVATDGRLQFDTELFNYYSLKLNSCISLARSGVKPVAAIGIDYGYQSPAAITAMENNLFRFSAGKTIAQIQQLNQAYRNAKNFEEFEQACLLINDKYYRAWAKTEYVTAGAIAESSATYNRLIAQTEIFPYWEYKTLDDGKVRPEHVKLHGLILPANDPLWNKIYPPNGWRCRCYVVPRMKHEVAGIDLNAMRAKAQQYLDSDEYKHDSESGFGTNRAISSIVFTENQNYVDLLTTNKTLNQMSVNDWGLMQLTKLLEMAKTTLPAYSGNAQQWFSGHAVNSVITITDHQSRPYTISKAVFERHTSGKYAKEDNNRVKLLTSIKEVLNSPDEIWLNAEKNKLAPNNRNYIKYYQGQAIVVCTKLVNGKLEIHSWFELNKNAEADFRRGMLIKKATPLE